MHIGHMSAAMAEHRSVATPHRRVGGWRSWGRRVVLACLLVAGSDAAMAVNCFGAPSDSLTIVGATLSVPRDLPVGSWLHEWSNPNPLYAKWSCTSMLSSGWYGPMARMEVGTIVPGIHASYTVYATSLPGVGVAVEWVAVVNGSPITGYYGALSGVYQASVDGTGYTSTSFGYLFRFRPIKTGPIQAGIANINGLQAGALLTEKVTSTSVRSFIANTIVAINFTGTWTIATLTCTTRDMTVPMGRHRKTDFSGVGSRVGVRDFNIAVTDCPAGLKNVYYSLSPLNGVIDPDRGVISLSADSNATGVGIQITDQSDTPLRFVPDSPAKRLAPARSGSFTIPLRAAYYQTGSDVIGGTANAQGELIMSYE